jgi:ribosomal protein S18 acetylase RimI-like enzyme
MHVLDNPVWHALTGPQSTVAEGTGLARRYREDVSVFAAIPDDAQADAWDELRVLIGPGRPALLVRRSHGAPPGWERATTMPAVQMTLRRRLGPEPATTGDHGVGMRELGRADVPAIIDLVERTEPGPFRTDTIELGTYLGVHDAEELVALAGERMRLPGYAEVSAVCTDPRHRGRGYAERLTRAVARRMQARGETPILHVLADNHAAIRLYERLGFTLRTRFEAVAWVAPA